MISKQKYLDRKKISDNILKNFKVVNFVDISDEFEYNDVLVYDCMVHTSMVGIAIQDEKGYKMTTLRDFPMLEKDISVVLESIIEPIEEEYKMRFDDDLIVDYTTYTFFDYVENIKFILVIDFSSKDENFVSKISQNIAQTQLSGKSKYLY